MVRIVIVDDNEGFLESATNYIKMFDNIFVVGCATNRISALEIIKSQTPDIVIVDLNLTENKLDGLNLIYEIKEMGNYNVIVLTNLFDENMVLDSFVLGAVEYVKKEDYKTIIEKIRVIHSNKNPLEILTRDYARLRREAVIRELTPSENQVITLAESGLRQSEILKQTNKTKIDREISNIKQKLCVNSLSEAVNKLKRKGIYYSTYLFKS